MSTPSASLIAWVAASISPGSRVVGISSLRHSGAPLLLRVKADTFSIDVVLKTGNAAQASDRERFITELTALEWGRSVNLPVPRPLAVDLDGRVDGRIALALTALPGSSVVPLRASKTRLRALGAAAAMLHRIHWSPKIGLPLRTRPIAGLRFDEARRTAATALLAGTARLIAETPVPMRQPVFLHGDLWQGNTLWLADKLVGIIDWDYAGIGPYGIDLGSLRCDVALMFGLPAADEVLYGWQEAMGHEATDVAYWDLVGVLNTPADIGNWLPIIREQGRADLDRTALAERLDEFHRAALDRYHRG